jgi:acetyl esterase
MVSLSALLPKMNSASKKLIHRDDELLSQAETLVYKELDAGPDLNAHLFFPPDERDGQGRTALVFFCGGGWDSGRITQFAPQALHFANRGAVTILAEYRTRSSHEASPVEAMQDARTAFRWVRHYAGQLGIDPARIVGIGAQAGANIAAAAAMKSDLPEDDTDPPGIPGAPNAVVMFGPLVEIAKSGFGTQAFTDSGTPPAAANLGSHIVKDLPPMLIFHGTRDRFAPIDSVVRFVKKTQQKGNVCDLIHFEGRQHSFFNLNVDLTLHDHCNAIVDKFLVHLGFLPEAPPSDDDAETVRVIS